MTPEAQPLMSDIAASLGDKTDAQALTILQRVADLFFDRYQSLGDEHVAVFDDVMRRLVGKAPDAALAQLSMLLAPLDKAPAQVVALLAQHDEIAVAGPVLEHSRVLADETLAEIAGTKSERHRAAIAARPELAETVTDSLVEYSHAAVACQLAANPGARFSPLGFVRLINHAKTDKDLAEAIASRTDVPSELEPFLKLALAS